VSPHDREALGPDGPDDPDASPGAGAQDGSGAPGPQDEIERLLGGSPGRRSGGRGSRPGGSLRADRADGPDEDDEGAAAAQGIGGGLPPGYVAVIGVLFAAIAVVAIILALVVPLETQESGSVGIGDVGLGEKVDPFAVPIATSDLEGDANIDPDQACSVPGDDVLRICDYFDRPLVVSFWFTKGASACIDEQDDFDVVASRFSERAGFVSINVRDDRDRVRELIDERGWEVTVGHDTDGAVSNIYRVGGCPTFLFIRPGGILERAEIGSTTVPELSAQVRSLIDGEEVPQAGTQAAPEAEAAGQ
jgi:hypothetical protein